MDDEIILRMFDENTISHERLGCLCKICRNLIEFDEMQRIALEMGRPVDVFPICEDCCAFIRKLKEREK